MPSPNVGPLEGIKLTTPANKACVRTETLHVRSKATQKVQHRNQHTHTHTHTDNYKTETKRHTHTHTHTHTLTMIQN